MLLPPQFVSVLDDFVLSLEPVRLWIYTATEGCTNNPPAHLSVFDYELNEDERTQYSLQFKETRRAYGLYTFSNEGAEYIGLGETKEPALAHGIYQILRQEHWDCSLPFIPSIEYTEAWIIDDKECLPAIYAPKNMDEEELEEYQGLDSIWSVEYAPNQFIWSPNYVNAVEILLMHIPESYEVH